MADNVLGILFQNIADAIRSKTGDTGKMSPSDFPSKILSIMVGGGATAKVTTLKQTFTSNTPTTVTHNLGVAPDIIIMWADGNHSVYGAIPNGSAILIFGFSSKFANAASIPAAWKGGMLRYLSGQNFASTNTFGETIEKTTWQSEGFISGANTTSFTVFGNIVNTAGNTPYNILAIGGLA